MIDLVHYRSEPTLINNYRLVVSILQGQERHCQEFRQGVCGLVWLLSGANVPKYKM